MRLPRCCCSCIGDSLPDGAEIAVRNRMCRLFHPLPLARAGVMRLAFAATRRSVDPRPPHAALSREGRGRGEDVYLTLYFLLSTLFYWGSGAGLSLSSAGLASSLAASSLRSASGSACCRGVGGRRPGARGLDSLGGNVPKRQRLGIAQQMWLVRSHLPQTDDHPRISAEIHPVIVSIEHRQVVFSQVQAGTLEGAGGIGQNPAGGRSMT